MNTEKTHARKYGSAYGTAIIDIQAENYFRQGRRKARSVKAAGPSLKDSGSGRTRAGAGRNNGLKTDSNAKKGGSGREY